MNFAKKITYISALKDLHLVWRAKEGDNKAFTKLYFKYMDGIFRYVFFRTGENRETAEDIVQETFLRSWKNLKKFNLKGGTFQAWVYAIARNLASDELKKNGKYIKLTPEIADPKGDVAENLISKNIQNYLIKQLNKLPDIQKEVTTLRFVNEISYREISKITGKSEKALRAVQYRALKSLKKSLSKKW